VIAHFEGVVTTELDLRLEAAAASEFRANTARRGLPRAGGVLEPLGPPGDDHRMGRGRANMGDIDRAARGGAPT
jgi:hypothetical protein